MKFRALPGRNGDVVQSGRLSSSAGSGDASDSAGVNARNVLLGRYLGPISGAHRTLGLQDRGESDFLRVGLLKGGKKS